MTAPRRPRHRLPDSLDIPAPAVPVEPPTQALPIVPVQRAAGPQAVPARPPSQNQRAHPPFAAARAPVGYPGPGVRAPSVPLPPPDRARRGVLPLVLAGATAAVLALGVVVVVVVESGGPSSAAPVSGR